MPPIFKALASITAWTLFILGWISLLVSNAEAIRVGAVFGTQAPPIQFYLANGLAIITLILSVCAMKLGQMLE